MKNILLLFLCVNTFLNCQSAPKKVFTNAALEDKFEKLDHSSVTFNDILNKYNDSYIFINVWASWCRDCIVSIPELKTFQKAHVSDLYCCMVQNVIVPVYRMGMFQRTECECSSVQNVNVPAYRM